MVAFCPLVHPLTDLFKVILICPATAILTHSCLAQVPEGNPPLGLNL